MNPELFITIHPKHVSFICGNRSGSNPHNGSLGDALIQVNQFKELLNFEGDFVDVTFA